MLLTPFANNLINLVQKRNRGNKHEPKHRPMFWAYSENFFCLFFACSLSYFDVFFSFRGNLCIDTLLCAAHDSQDSREHGQLASNWLAISTLHPFYQIADFSSSLYLPGVLRTFGLEIDLKYIYN